MRDVGRTSSVREMTATIDDFCADGFLVVRGAVAPDTVRACVDVIEHELRARAVDPRDPKTWTQPVVRLPCPEGPVFATAATSPALRETYDALLGPGCWIQREGVGGTVPVRFPSKKDPGDAGWHIDGSYDVDGQWWVNVHSRGRGLLALFLFTDVGDADAPTEILWDLISMFPVSSHHLAPGVCSSATWPEICLLRPSNARVSAQLAEPVMCMSAIHSSFIAPRGRISVPDRA
jgi:hypothetical protein